MARLNKFESAAAMAQSVTMSRRSLLLRSYIRDIEVQTGLRIPANQRTLLAENLRGTNYTRLSREAQRAHRAEFETAKTKLIQEWERNTGQTWPTYAADVRNARGGLLRAAGSRYDAHHIIESSYGGPNTWWNIHPARFPGQHQGGIHRGGSPLRSIFER
jgi:predicted ribonuclease toxin of YeeF-YezG toxin-antitoxin module